MCPLQQRDLNHSFLLESLSSCPVLMYLFRLFLQPVKVDYSSLLEGECISNASQVTTGNCILLPCFHLIFICGKLGLLLLKR